MKTVAHAHGADYAGQPLGIDFADDQSLVHGTFGSSKGVIFMQSPPKLLALLLLSVFTALFVGCGGTGSPVPGSSSESSEAADAAGGVNKTATTDAGAPNTGGAKVANESKDTESKVKATKIKEAKEKETPTEVKPKGR